jgi:hypothetical protein
VGKGGRVKDGKKRDGLRVGKRGKLRVGKKSRLWV